VRALDLDAAAAIGLARRGLIVPGLSVWMLCSR
jgi:hypothetical protein